MDTLSPLVAMLLLDRSCVIVGFFLKYYVPQQDWCADVLTAEAFSNTVDVVERLRDPTDQVPNARHLRDLHTFSSVMSLEL